MIAPPPSIQQNSYTSPTPPKQEQLWQSWQIDLAALSRNSIHKVIEGADHASFWLGAETAKVSVAAILQVVGAGPHRTAIGTAIIESER